MKRVIVHSRGLRVTLDRSAIDRAFARAYARRSTRALARIQHAFALNKTELGRLLGGVTRQAIDDWYAKGVPVNRVADVERIAGLAATLQRRFKPERLPQIVRAPLPGLEGQSIVQALATRGVAPVLDMLERAFSYHPAA